jgi:hypothetical protein
MKVIEVKEVGNILDENKKLTKENRYLKSELKSTKILKAAIWDKYLKLMDDFKEL